MLNLLDMACIRAVQPDGKTIRLTLPGTLAALDADQVEFFTTLRPHQRHAFHAFCVQLMAVCRNEQSLEQDPLDEAAWRMALLALTPDHPDGAAWSLVMPPDRPALLQPAIGTVTGLKPVLTPDALDMLVTSRNHDLKQARMMAAQLDDWLFALVTLQTCEGFLGAGNYGIARMNGGFANRPGLSLSPPGGPGAHARRDVLRLLALRRNGHWIMEQGHKAQHGLALSWLHPWDGTQSLSIGALDPFHIEICRRIRLVEKNGVVFGLAGNSVVPRIAPLPGGLADGWTPLLPDDKEGFKVLSIPSDGFSYRRMVNLLFPNTTSGGRLAPLQEISSSDATDGLVLVARALARGQGKTEGYHERRVRLSGTKRRGLTMKATDPEGEIAHLRVRLAGELAMLLRQVLMVLFQNGPEPGKLDLKHRGSAARAQTFCDRFQDRIDTKFFDSLWQELDVEQGERFAIRREWLQHLYHNCEALLLEASLTGGRTGRRDYVARLRAEALLGSGTHRNKVLAPYFQKEEANVL